jgi:hypothetical protein
MGSKRVGLARTQALLQGLKREILMTGSTFVSYDGVGGASDSTVGTGFHSGSVFEPTTKVTTINGEIITTIAFDLTNLSASGTTQKIIGNKEAGVAETAPAHLVKWSTAKNGVMYKAEMSCMETPTCAEGTPVLDFDLEAADNASVYNADPAGNIAVVFTAGGNFAQGTSIQDLSVGDVGNDQFIYLIAGNAAGQGGKYTAGQFILKLYGHKELA